MNKARFKAVAYLLLSSLIFSQCTKIDTTKVGAGLIPGVDNIHTFDTTFHVIANNFDDITQCDSIGYNDLLASGIITNNPLFGSTKAEMYFQLKPSVIPVILPAHDTLSMVVDSVVLVLKYNHSYGDTNVMQKLKVYELGGDFKRDSVYKTCDKFIYFPDEIGEVSFTPTSLRDSIHAFREDDNNQLRIKLPNSYGENYINNAANLTSDSLFQQYFKGFAVVPDDATGGEAINYFDLTSSSSRLSIYVRSKRDTILDTASINLTYTSTSMQANYIENQRGTSQITQFTGNNPSGDSLLFVQTYPSGSYVKLSIPALSSFPNSVINRAELIVEQVYDPLAAQFNVPNLLYLDIPDSSGKYIPIPCDFSLTEAQSGFSSLGGKPKKITNQQSQQIARYTFNISRYVQSIVTRKDANATIRLRAPFYIENYSTYLDRCGQTIGLFSFMVNSASDGGVKLNGTNQNNSGIRLHVIYSKL